VEEFQLEDSKPHTNVLVGISRDNIESLLSPNFHKIPSPVHSVEVEY
jgi:hypothetical protein